LKTAQFVAYAWRLLVTDFQDNLSDGDGLFKYIIQKYFVLLTVLHAFHYDTSIRSTRHRSKYRAAWQMKDKLF